MKKKFSLLVALLLVFPISAFAVNDLVFDANVTVEITTTDDTEDVTFTVASGSNFTEMDINDNYVDLTLDADSDLIVANDGSIYFQFEVQSGTGSSIPTCPSTSMNITSTGNTVVRLTALSNDPNCSEGGGGGDGGNISSGASARASTTVDSSPNSNSDSNSNSYEQEVGEVRDRGLVEKELDKSTDKCEALTIMARALDWDYDESVNDDGFSDTPDWCKPVAKYAKDMGYVEGRSAGVFGLDTPMNRFEFVVILYRILGGEAGSDKAPYSDEIMEWAVDAVNWAYENGYMTGYADGTFGGSNGILKQDVGVVMIRLN
jgi:hypothetical protein